MNATEPMPSDEAAAATLATWGLDDLRGTCFPDEPGLSTRTSNGWSAWHFACSSGDTSMCRWLKAKEAYLSERWGPTWATPAKPTGVLVRPLFASEAEEWASGMASTMINAIVLPTGGWWLMGLPYLIRIRRMMPNVKVVGSSDFNKFAGIDSLGKSLEIIRQILTPGGGGIPALLSGEDWVGLG